MIPATKIYFRHPRPSSLGHGYLPFSSLPPPPPPSQLFPDRANNRPTSKTLQYRNRLGAGVYFIHDVVGPPDVRFANPHPR